jgi:hypothetical protein
MKLSELYPPQINSTLSEEIALIFQDREQLDEAIWDSLKIGFSQIITAIGTIAKTANTKSQLNDSTMRKIYTDELAKLKTNMEKLPLKANSVIWTLLLKFEIKPSGIDLSRKNLNRIIVVKLMRLVVYIMSQMKDQGIEWILSSVVSGGLSTIISLLMNAKDYAGIATELSNSARQLKTLFDKAQIRI